MRRGKKKEDVSGYFFSNNDLKKLIIPLIIEQIMGVKLEMGILGIWIAMTIDWLFRAICFTVRYVRGKWEKKSLAD